MNKQKLNKFFIFMMMALLLLIPEPGTAEEIAMPGKVTVELIEVPRLEPDYSLAVTATELLNQINSREVVLVDIRSPEEFERLRIPGSINVALYAIKTKAFLKTQPFVLVNAGFQWRDLENECHRLEKNGFKPSILLGGLVAWQSQGGTLIGDQLLIATYRKVPAHLFFHEKDYQNIKVFDVSPQPLREGKTLIPGIVNVNNIESLLKHAKQYGPTHRILVLLNEHADPHEKFVAAFKKAGISNAFFLESGLNGYRKFLKNTALSLKSKKERIVTLGGCNTCGQKNQEEQNIHPRPID
ncbi:MAG: rhodanese-like domain-containing protein [Desulfobacterales bacterium]